MDVHLAVLKAMQLSGATDDVGAATVARVIDPDCVNPARLRRDVVEAAANDDRLIVTKDGRIRLR